MSYTDTERETGHATIGSDEETVARPREIAPALSGAPPRRALADGLGRRWEGRVRRVLSGKTRGMTLIEIMVVIAIIGIFATAISYGVFTYLQKARVDACRAQLRKIGNVLTIYAAEHDFPSSLDVLTDRSSGFAPLRDRDLIDPWQTPIQYNYPSSRSGELFDLCSAGPDRQPGTEDDVCLDD